MPHTKGHPANANAANGKCISGADQNCPSKINNCSDGDFGRPDACWKSLWIKSRAFDNFMSFLSENVIFHGVEEAIWVTDLLRQILTNKEASLGWVEVMGTSGEVMEWGVTNWASESTGRWISNNWGKKSARLCGVGEALTSRVSVARKSLHGAILVVWIFPVTEGEHGEATREPSAVSQGALMSARAKRHQKDGKKNSGSETKWKRWRGNQKTVSWRRRGLNCVESRVTIIS